MMYNRFDKFLIALAFICSIFGLYLLSFTNWKIWILNKFHLYLIFISWFIGCIYAFRELFFSYYFSLLNKSNFYIESNDNIITKQTIIDELSSFFNWKSTYKGMFGVMHEAEYKTSKNQTIWIDYSETSYSLTIMGSLPFLSQKKFLNIIENKLISLIENKANL